MTKGKGHHELHGFGNGVRASGGTCGQGAAGRPIAAPCGALQQHRRYRAAATRCQRGATGD